MRSFVASFVVIAACGDSTPQSGVDAEPDATAAVDVGIPCSLEVESTLKEQPAAPAPFVFQVVSDVHAHSTDPRSYTNIVTAMNDLKSVGPTTAALVINGDLTEHGYASEYSYLTQALFGRAPANTIFNIGNHEYHGTDSSSVELARYLAFAKLSTVYYERTVGPYTFLMLGGENGDGDLPSLAWTAVLSDAQLAWLDQRLAAVASPTKPTFVFLHQGPMDTNQNAKLKQILAAYPNVVYFWSHWHRDLHSPGYDARMFSNADGFRLVHTSAVQYVWDISNAMHYEWAQGLQIEVHADYIEVRGRDFAAHSWVSQFDFLHEYRTPSRIGSLVVDDEGELEVFVAGKTGEALFGAQSNDGTIPPLAGESWTASSAPVVASNADGSLDVFARGSDGALWHTHGSGQTWSAWTSIGGNHTSNVAVARNADGTLEVFARGTDNALYHAWEMSPGGAFSGWGSLGGILSSDPAIAVNADGRLEAFARIADGTLAHVYRKTDGSWSAWMSLGHAVGSSPVVGRSADGRLEVFALDTNGALIHVSQVASNSGWGTFADLGGDLRDAPALVTALDGHFEIYARGSDDSVQRIAQASDGTWSKWTSLGGAIASSPIADVSKDGKVHVFARAKDGTLAHVSQESAACWSWDQRSENVMSW